MTITDEQVELLNAARTALTSIAATADHTITGNAVARVRCEDAEHAIFRALSALWIYAGCENVTEDQVHNRVAA